MTIKDPLLDLVKDSDHREVGGVELDIVRACECRVKRLIYPAGFRWSTHMKPMVGTDLCMPLMSAFSLAEPSTSAMPTDALWSSLPHK